MGLYSIFGTSVRAMGTYTTAMSIAANNVANASNEDYSRQRVHFTTLRPESAGRIEIGRGIDLGSVSQVVNQVTEDRLTLATQNSGNYTARSSYLKSVESAFNEVGGGGLNDQLSEFFNSWTALSAEPDSASARNNVLTTAKNVVDQFHSYSDQIDKLRSASDSEVANSVKAINAKLQAIASVNNNITETTGPGLEYHDERRRLVNELGSLIDISVVDTGSDFQIYTSSGVPLLNNAATATLSAQINPDNDNLKDIKVTIGESTSNITNQISSGKLAGLLQVRDTDLVNYKSKLDDLAYTFAQQINTLHQSGYNLDGNTNKKFFSTIAAVDGAAANISISSDVDGQPNKIAAAAAADEVPGGNTIALSIAATADSDSITFDDGTSTSFAGFFGDLLANIGNDSELSQSQSDFQDSVVEQIKLDRSQESGVNVDEEQVNIMKYQSAYQAAAQMVKIADEVIQTLFSAVAG